ncbi:MAG TPA: GMC oxidoreductase, partial [Solirubrobacteraceae bacterium]|nr:GMC oxidoreductase [Solirubrobacteraceae bacterium]
EPERWPPGLARRARNAFPADIKHVPLKPAYGSLFPYALNDPDLSIASENADTLSSLAYGGLSNAWGASVLPFRQPDIEDWPISLADLEPHYEAVQRFVPVAAERDELSRTLPLYTDTPGALRRGRQAETVLDHLRRHAPALAAAGFTFGASRLAVAASADDPRHCRHCGMCLYGCPYGSIYNAAHTIEQLRRSGRIDYRGGIYVDRLTEVGGSVTIDFHERGRPTATGRLTAPRVFVACGAISSTRLMLSSTRRAQHVCQMQDSQYFVVPMVTRHAAPVSVATQGNTLAQVFVEIDGGHVSEHAVHLQIYGYNDIMLSALAKRLPLSPAGLERISRPALGRLVVIQGFLHSADSPGLTVSYDRDRLRVVGGDVTIGAARVRRLVRRLAGHARLLGMVPLPGLSHLGRPGKSNHLGGSFRMRRDPGELDTDVLGRIPAWERVHIVDASVFPSVPATTVTLSVMANAHRIATAAAGIGG